MYPTLQSGSSVTRLKNLTLFAQCTTKELRRIETLMTETRVHAGSVLTSFAEPGAEFFVVIEGTATVWREGTRLETVGAGGFFGEQSLLAHAPRTATVIADTDMDLFVLSRQEFRSPHFLIPPVMERMLEVLSERLRRADERWSGALVLLRPSPEVIRKRLASVSGLP